MTNEEFYQALKEQNSIVDYAKELGFTVVRKGKYYSLKEHDSVIIDLDRNCFWRNSKPGIGRSIGKGGSIIDFICEFEQVDYKEAIKILKQRTYLKYTTVKKKTVEEKKEQPFELPKKADNMRMVFAYLTKTRCISQKVVQDFVNRKMLYQDKNNNCVFVGYDINNSDKPVFACKRGTNTYNPFYGDVAGCDYEKCFYVENNSETLCVTESVIDAMSVMTLTLNDSDKMNYLVLAGVGKWKCIRNYLLTGKFKKVVIAVDNDKGGMETAELLWGCMDREFSTIQKSKVLPPANKGKDWNEVLQSMKKG